MNKVRVGVVGVGYWGPNIIRNVAQSALFELAVLCDRNAQSMEKIKKLYPQVSCVADAKLIFADPSIDAVIIVTDILSHEKLGLAALAAGKHVFIEKPLAATGSACQRLMASAKKHKRILMVGHTFLYNNAVHALKQLMKKPEFGETLYLHCQRLNLGRVQFNTGTLWSMAPHDVSIVNYLLDARPTKVSASGFSFLTNEIEDIAFMNLVYPNNKIVHIHVSWLYPEKIRKISVVGSKQMIVYDDVSAEAKLVIYDKSMVKPVGSGQVTPYKDFSEFQYDLRVGDVHIPRVDFKEPLRVEMKHFAECIQKNQTPVSDGQNGYEVVKVLETAEKSLRLGGKELTIKW